MSPSSSLQRGRPSRLYSPNALRDGAGLIDLRRRRRYLDAVDLSAGAFQVSRVSLHDQATPEWEAGKLVTVTMSGS